MEKPIELLKTQNKLFYAVRHGMVMAKLQDACNIIESVQELMAEYKGTDINPSIPEQLEYLDEMIMALRFRFDPELQDRPKKRNYRRKNAKNGNDT